MKYPLGNLKTGLEPDPRQPAPRNDLRRRIADLHTAHMLIERQCMGIAIQLNALAVFVACVFKDVGQQFPTNALPHGIGINIKMLDFGFGRAGAQNTKSANRSCPVNSNQTIVAFNEFHRDRQFACPKIDVRLWISPMGLRTKADICQGFRIVRYGGTDGEEVQIVTGLALAS